MYFLGMVFWGFQNKFQMSQQCTTTNDMIQDSVIYRLSKELLLLLTQQRLHSTRVNRFLTSEFNFYFLHKRLERQHTVDYVASVSFPTKTWIFRSTRGGAAFGPTSWPAGRKWNPWRRSWGWNFEYFLFLNVKASKITPYHKLLFNLRQTLQTTPDQYPRGVYLRTAKKFSPSWRRRPYVYISPQATECGFAMLITHRMCRLSITHDETATARQSCQIDTQRNQVWADHTAKMNQIHSGH